MLDQRLLEYIEDPNDPIKNYNLGIEYDKLNQTAAAMSFFLRAADKSEDNKELAYECLIHIARCFDRQGNRTEHVYGSLRQAISILPKRPEAYYYICRIKNWNNLFEDAYYLSSIALDVCDFDNLNKIANLIDYQGKKSLLFEKALASWHWGKVDECKERFLNLCAIHWDDLTNYEKNTTEKYLKEHYDINIKNLLNKFDSIPVIGVPFVNGIHWLKRLIESIDYPVEDLVIINNNGRGEFDEELNQLANQNYDHIGKIKVTHLPANIGCSGAWNLIVKSYMNCPYWIIANNDICFSPGMLEKMHQEAMNTDCGMVHAKRSDWGGGSYDLFLIKDFVVQACGLFDENLYPIYAEDVDYHIRIKNENIKLSYLDLDYLHGEKDYATSGSQTWRLDTNLKEKMDKGRILNETEYLTKKWGSNYQSLNTYSTPFNKSEYDSRFTTYDLNFVRRKHLGF